MGFKRYVLVSERVAMNGDMRDLWDAIWGPFLVILAAVFLVSLVLVVVFEDEMSRAFEVGGKIVQKIERWADEP